MVATIQSRESLTNNWRRWIDKLAETSADKTSLIKKWCGADGGEGGDGTRSAPVEMKWETRVALRPAADRVFIDQPAAGDKWEAGWLAAAARRPDVRVGGRYI